ncbi:MAG: heparinase II/III family protein [Clostridia bacterium]|nr:heparinase II/III family protein [Clostridia bacterium]
MRLPIKKFFAILISLVLLNSNVVPSFAYDNINSASYQNASCNEQSSDAIALLGEDVMFMPCGNFFAHGQKCDCSEYGADSFLENGVLMADAKVLEFAFDVDISVSGGIAAIDRNEVNAVSKNGINYVSASDAAKALGMYVYDSDNRGFVIASDKALGYTNSIYSHDNQETIDIIWRYMQFDRPGGDELLNSIKNSEVYRSHPRLLIKEDEVAALRERISENQALNQKKKLLFSCCDNYLNVAPVEPALDGIRLFGSCYSVKERLINLCMAYLLADDEDKKNAYAQRAWEELDSACNWDNWNLTVHFLDSGEIGPGIAFAYDVLYNYLDDVQKKSVRDRVNDLYLEYCEGIYTVPRTSNYDPMSYRSVQCNWGAVCSASMLMLSLTFMDEEDDASELTQRCKFIASNAMQTLEHIVTALSPEGNWDEGLGYWEYVLQHTAWSFLSLQNIFGTDYNFLSASGVSALPEYGMYNQTELGSFNKSSMTGTSNAFAPEALCFAKLCNRADKMAVYNDFYNLVDSNAFLAQYLLFYDPDFASGSEQEDLPLDIYYSSNGTGVMKGSWHSADSVYVGISGGKTTTYNDTHYDKGSFVFEALGERWSIDMGRNGNDTMPYLKRAETHSTLVVNPTADGVGQSFDADTFAERFESKSRGAVGIYNLTNAYGEYADSYKRGFMLGDDRNTLTVRDEISLKAQSELVWNMITEADIEISADKKTAYLYQNGKKLLVSASSSSGNWAFSRTDDLAPTGGWVDGDGGFSISQQKQFAGNAKKLTLTCTASGNTYIEVKLIPVIEGENYSGASESPLSSWTIPDGELVGVIIPEINSGSITNSADSLMIPVTVTGDFENITLYADGKAVDVIDEQSADSRYNLVLPKESMTMAGELMLNISAKYPTYTLNKKLLLNICKEYNLNSLASVDFEAYPDGEPTTEQVRKALGLRYIDLKSGYGKISKSQYEGSDCMKFSLIKSKDVNSGSMAFIQLDKAVGSGNIVHLSFDALASKKNLKLMLSFSKAYTIFNTNGKFFDGGDIAYQTDELYHIDYVADTLNGQYRICVLDSDGNAVAEKSGSFGSDTYNGSMRLSFGVSSGDDGYFLIDNMKIEKSDYMQIIDQSHIGDGVFSLNRSIKSMGMDDLSSSVRIIGFYNNKNKLISTSEYDFDADGYLSAVCDIPDDASCVKVFFWSDVLMPYTKCMEKTMENQ